MSTIDVSILDLGTIYLLLAIPLILIASYRIGLVRRTLTAVVRMSVQLALVGLYLGFIFDLNNPVLNATWLAVMIVVANYNILKSTGISTRRFFLMTLFGITIAIVVVLSVFVFAAIGPDPFYDARYVIPIGGMLLGNCLRGNIIALERFYSGIVKNERQFLTYIFMGATVREATHTHMRSALGAALAPTVSTMTTMGIVSLPGMMTGQILGGSDPTIAIKYQLAIMVAIFVATSLGAYLNLRLSMRVAFSDRGTLRHEVLVR